MNKILGVWSICMGGSGKENNFVCAIIYLTDACSLFLSKRILNTYPFNIFLS